MNRKINPPRMAQALFAWYCRNASVEDLEGDLEELFISDVRSMPVWKAQLRYWKGVLSLMFSYSIRKRKKAGATHTFSSASTIDMFLSYFKISWRSLAKHRFFTIINVLGLAVGMSISLLLISMLAYVSRYDSFHEKRDQIYRITTTVRDNSRVTDFASSSPLLAERIRHELPGVEKVVRVSKTLNGTALTGKKEIPLSGYFAEQTFLEVFTFPLVKGNAANALTKPMSLLLTESAAVKTFGEEEALGKLVTIEPWGTFEVTGILKDHPKASHLNFEAVASYNSMTQAERQRKKWNDFANQYTYIQLSDKYGANDMDSYLKKIPAQVMKAKTGEEQQTFAVQSLNDIATGKEFSNEIGPQWGYTSFIIFGVLNLLILLPACFNYANISISRSLKRAREIGLRKTVGGLRSQIFAQFITETVLVTLTALGGAFLIFTQIREEFLNMLVAGEGIELNAEPQTILYFVLFAILTGLFAGSIPAIYFARMNPVQALKNTASLKRPKALSFQKAIVITQFALSLGFIMGVVIVLQQYRKTLNYHFGFEQAHILDVELQDADPARFRSAFSKLASVHNLSMSSGVAGTNQTGQSTIRTLSDRNDSLLVSYMHIDSRYLENLQIPLIAGKTFPEHSSPREKFIIVNEEFLRSYRFTDAASALGQSFVIDDSVEVQIIGVVKNFHYNNLRERIGSFVFRNREEFAFANLSIASTDIQFTIEEMEAAWKSIGSVEKFKARFFQDEIQESYSFYFSLIKICGFLGFLAITISCLGLLGMVVYTTENRMKELGIRKVMGATRWHLAMLLSKGYLKLMVISAFIATPLTYLIFDQLLLQMQFYRFQIGPAEVLISLAIMVMLGGATIFSQTIKASETNPVDTLKAE